MSDPRSTYVRTQRDLDELCVRLGAAGRFGLDTEFHRETTFVPHLCLVQVALPDELALVDPLVGLDFGPFHRVLLDPAVLKVVHAGEQDLEIFFRATGRIPRPVFDTQVVAALAGYGDQIGYSNLVEGVCRVKIHKGETLSDWARRPLSDEQLRYAYDDVRHLLAVHDALTSRLAELGRAAWAAEEIARLERPDRFEFDPESYRNIRSAWSLDRRALAVLRELVAWREEEAYSADEPRGRIARDDGLIGLARRQPTKARDLKGYRALHRTVIDRCEPDILAAVARALELPEADLPPPVQRPENDAAQSARVDLLWSFVRSVAMEQKIGPQTLAGRDLLASVVSDPPADAAALLARPEWAGWRGEVLAESLAGILSGRWAVAIAEPGRPAPLALVERR